MPIKSINEIPPGTKIYAIDWPDNVVAVHEYIVRYALKDGRYEPASATVYVADTPDDAFGKPIHCMKLTDIYTSRQDAVAAFMAQHKRWLDMHETQIIQTQSRIDQLKDLVK